MFSHLTFIHYTNHTCVKPIIEPFTCIYNQFLADESNGDGSEIPVGKTAFSFMFDLQASSKLPSSFESYNGYVRYTLNASIDKKVFSGYSCKRAITVLAHLNLNDENNVEVILKYVCLYVIPFDSRFPVSISRVRKSICSKKKGYNDFNRT